MPDQKTPLERLREKFPPEVEGILPKPYKAESPKGNCNVCGGYHGLPAAHLPFVGHAAITDRLLAIDPEWNWDFVATDPNTGMPLLDAEKNLWITLTVCGVTRKGCGDGPSMKVRIGDALRNAAMRFGVALYLWTKDELESDVALESDEKPTARARAPKSQPAPETPKSQPAPDKAVYPETEKARRAMWAVAHEKFPDESEFRAWIAKGLGLDPDVSLSTLTREQMVETTGHLRNLATPDGPNIASASR
jgi:hypothetical protein